MKMCNWMSYHWKTLHILMTTNICLRSFLTIYSTYMLMMMALLFFKRNTVSVHFFCFFKKLKMKTQLQSTPNACALQIASRFTLIDPNGWMNEHRKIYLYSPFHFKTEQQQQHNLWERCTFICSTFLILWAAQKHHLLQYEFTTDFIFVRCDYFFCCPTNAAEEDARRRKENTAHAIIPAKQPVSVALFLQLNDE